MPRPFLYVAGPLFSAAERAFNKTLKDRLVEAADVFLPQEHGLFIEILMETRDPAIARTRVFERDLAALRRADGVLIVLDGRSIDEGACFELGYAFALQKRCVGLRTDPRQLLPTGHNPMIESALEQTVADLDGAVMWTRGLRPL